MTEDIASVPYIRRSLRDVPAKFDPPTDGVLRFNGLDTAKIRPMGLNECLFPPSPKIAAAICDNINVINRYPDAQCPALGKIIAERTRVPRDRIVWGNGSEELIKGAIDLSVSPGDGLVLPVPTFWGYRGMIGAAAADATFVEQRADGTVDIDAIIAGIGNHTRLVFCITPNNPTGSLVTKEELSDLAARIPENVLLFIDEAYFDFGVYAGGPDAREILADRRGPWIIARTFSKSYAMAGMRIGYALCSSDDLAQALRKTTCVFNVPILAQFAAAAALEDEDHLQALLAWTATGRGQLSDGLRDQGLAPLSSVANFVSVSTGLPGREVVRAMLDLGVQIHAWPDPGYENFIRITVGGPEDNKACLAVLREVLNETT